MKLARLDEMKGGWFIGDFSPACLQTTQFEVGCKVYKAGTYERRHVHRIATEVTVIISGQARMNGRIVNAGDIVLLEAGESSDFLAIEENTTTLVVKSPSVIGDKYPCEAGEC